MKFNYDTLAPREQKMVEADEMARSIGATGRVALYGIFFDTAKADLKPESNPTLAEITGLLNADPKLAVLIVGHTDNQGKPEYNQKLSEDRAFALIVGQRGHIGPSQLKSILENTSVDILKPGADVAGKGRVNAVAATE